MRRSRAGFSLIELLIVVAIITVIVTIAVPGYNRAMLDAKGTAALGAIKALHAAQLQYLSQYGRYAASLAELGPPESGEPSAASAGLIGRDLASGEKSGYRFQLSRDNGGYAIHAEPMAYKVTGIRSFYSDQAMIVYENRGPGPASPASSEVK